MVVGGKRGGGDKGLKYLGYIFQRSSKQEKQIRDRVRREMAVMGQGG